MDDPRAKDITKNEDTVNLHETKILWLIFIALYSCPPPVVHGGLRGPTREIAPTLHLDLPLPPILITKLQNAGAGTACIVHDRLDLPTGHTKQPSTLSVT